MKKLVINATEGGCHIRGTERLPLREAIAKFCQKPIDKSVIKKYLTTADDGDALIEKVIPLLKTDIKNLDEIALQARRGLAACRGLKNLIQRPGYKGILTKDKEKLLDKQLKKAGQESGGDFLKMNQLFYKRLIKKLNKGMLRNVIILSDKNFRASEKARIASFKNPLVNLHIYGVSRTIQGRDLKVKETLNHFLKHKKDALTRIHRNELILKAAKEASESLKKSYKETYKLLKKYDKTKDESLLVSTEKETVDLSDAEDYFKVGNFAHPLIDAQRVLIEDPHNERAKTVYMTASAMKIDAIDEAKANEAKNGDRESRLLRYNDLLERSKAMGRKDKDFDNALRLLRKAAKLMPEETEARWGIATALHHGGKIKEALKAYKALVKDFPDNLQFQFEYGQVLLRDNNLQGGLKAIGEVMDKTEEFDYFLARLGEIYQHTGLIEEAALAYESYLKKYPSNYEIWAKHGDCLSELGKKAKARKAYKTALNIRPGYDIAIRALRLL